MQINKKKVTPEMLLAEGKVTRTLQPAENEKYYMYYALKEKAFEGMQGLGKGNITSLKDVFLIDDSLNIRYIASNGKEYGDNINDKILEDETEIRFASKAFSEYISSISGVTEENMKFKWMKKQKNLTIADTNVDSLQDLVFFPNLEILQLGDWENNIPPITTMDGVENCTKLTNLTILYGPNKDYTAVGKLVNLKMFTKQGGTDYINIIESIKTLTNLQTLRIANNKVKDMKKLEELQSDLTSLALVGNEITKIDGLKNMSNLISLNLESNDIRKIEGLDNLTMLEVLNLWNNHISDITPLSANTELM